MSETFTYEQRIKALQDKVDKLEQAKLKTLERIKNIKLENKPKEKLNKYFKTINPNTEVLDFETMTILDSFNVIHWNMETLDIHKSFEKATLKIIRTIAQLNAGWFPDFTNKSLKFRIYCNGENRLLIESNNEYIETDIRFYIKDRETAEKILKECEKQYKVLFGIEL